jgi:hypothetical protein
VVQFEVAGAVRVLGCCRGVEVVRVDPGELVVDTTRLVRHLAPVESRDLVEVELVEEVPNTSPRRYRVADSNVVRELFELNSALNNVGRDG